MGGGGTSLDEKTFTRDVKMHDLPVDSGGLVGGSLKLK